MNDPALQATAFAEGGMPQQGQGYPQGAPPMQAPPGGAPMPPPPEPPAPPGAPPPPEPPAPPGAGPAAGGGPAPSADDGPRRVLAGFLYSFQDDNYGKHWVLHDGDNLVGRAETSVKCDVPIAHGTTSTRHASITCNNGTVTVNDMKSTNGTYVNGRRIDPNVPTPLNDGDKIRFGGFTCYLCAAKNRS